MLRDQLIATPRDWPTAADGYAQQHDRYFAPLRRIHAWYRNLWFDVGPEIDAMRARALPRLADDPTRMVDFLGLGPEAPSDEAARSRLFGDA